VGRGARASTGLCEKQGGVDLRPAGSGGPLPATDLCQIYARSTPDLRQIVLQAAPSSSEPRPISGVRRIDAGRYRGGEGGGGGVGI
jgi:hypothetical protein